MSGNVSCNYNDEEIRRLVENKKYMHKTMYFLADELPTDPSFRKTLERVTRNEPIETETEPDVRYYMFVVGVQINY